MSDYPLWLHWGILFQIRHNVSHEWSNIDVLYELISLYHSQYWYFIWEWRFHSIIAAMGFPLRDKITGGYPIKMKFTFFVRVDFQFQGHLKVKVTWRSAQIQGHLKGQLKVKVKSQGHLKVYSRSNFKVKVTWRSVQDRMSRSSEGQGHSSVKDQG